MTPFNWFFSSFPSSLTSQGDDKGSEVGLLGETQAVIVPIWLEL